MCGDGGGRVGGTPEAAQRGELRVQSKRAPYVRRLARVMDGSGGCSVPNARERRPGDA